MSATLERAQALFQSGAAGATNPLEVLDREQRLYQEVLSSSARIDELSALLCDPNGPRDVRSNPKKGIAGDLARTRVINEREALRDRYNSASDELARLNGRGKEVRTNAALFCLILKALEEQASALEEVRASVRDIVDELARSRTRKDTANVHRPS